VAIDDAFSDLDKERRSLFFKEIEGQAQLFIALHSKNEISHYNLPLFTINNSEVLNVAKS